MNKTWILLLVFVFTIVPIIALSYEQGKWDGMEKICPKPNIIATNFKLQTVMCYSPEIWAELTTVEREEWNFEEFMEDNYGSEAQS